MSFVRAKEIPLFRKNVSPEMIIPLVILTRMSNETKNMEFRKIIDEVIEERTGGIEIFRANVDIFDRT